MLFKRPDTASSEGLILIIKHKLVCVLFCWRAWRAGVLFYLFHYFGARSCLVGAVCGFNEADEMQPGSLTEVCPVTPRAAGRVAFQVKNKLN